MRLTEQCVLEHAVWLDLIKWCLEQTFLFELVIVIVVHRRELLSLILISKCEYVFVLRTHFFVQEFQIRSALVLDIIRFVGLVVPVCFLLPLLVLFFFLVLIGEVEVVFLFSFFAV
jgi:hypothetical protein